MPVVRLPGDELLETLPVIADEIERIAPRVDLAALLRCPGRPAIFSCIVYARAQRVEGGLRALLAAIGVLHRPQPLLSGDDVKPPFTSFYASCHKSREGELSSATVAERVQHHNAERFGFRFARLPIGSNQG